MVDKFIQAPGELVSLDKLRCAKAIELSAFLRRAENPYARYLETRNCDSVADVVVFEVDVELGQLQKHPIQPSERIAVVFYIADEFIPDVLALRQDFPEVPHLNIRAIQLPRSLCLYEEKYSDIKRTWTPARFVERVRNWLALTAKGKLHSDDQPLEQLLPASDYTLVIPSDAFRPNWTPLQKLFVHFASENKNKGVLIATEQPTPHQGPSCVAIPLQCGAQTHGIIHRAPANLAELHKFLSAAGLDLLKELRERLRHWNEHEHSLLNARVILVVAFPKKRNDASAAESTEVRGFLSSKTLLEIGVAVGLWNVHKGIPGTLIPTDTTKTGTDVQIQLVNIVFALSAISAARMNGCELQQSKLTAVGAGALGSQTILNLVRSGYGKWVIIDEDQLLPHNLARHALGGEFVGRNKALALQQLGNSFFAELAISKAIPADVSRLTTQDSSDAFKDASAIIDFSASISVASHLTHSIDCKARRVSIFLNPTGTDLVILAEDTKRTTSLDSLEMQYYRAVTSEPQLLGHLQQVPGRLRYANTCRDITSDIPQDYVAIHAGIAARAIRQALAQDTSTIKIWRINPADLQVTAVTVAPTRVFAEQRGDWIYVADKVFLKKLHMLRNAKLPKETGGVLLGSIDVARKVVYLVDTIPSPPDSEEWPTIYIRGSEGLATSVKQVSAATMNMLEYVGEWHSHPNGCDCRPSKDDQKVFRWLTKLMDTDGLPACMVIVGEKRQTAVFLGQMVYV